MQKRKLKVYLMDSSNGNETNSFLKEKLHYFEDYPDVLKSNLS